MKNIGKGFDKSMAYSIGVDFGTLSGRAVLVDVKTGEERMLDLDGVFIAVGMTPETEIVSKLLQTDETGYIVAGEDCKTNIPGVFVAGDTRTKKVRQLVTAAADGAVAATGCANFISHSFF